MSRDATVEELVVVSTLFTLATHFRLVDKLLEQLEQYYARDSAGYRCKLCGHVIPYSTSTIHLYLCAHLFRDHPEKFYRIEEQVLEDIRSRSLTRRRSALSKAILILRQRMPVLFTSAITRAMRKLRVTL